MKYEFYQNLSNLFILIGVLLTALGGYGSYHFGKKSDKQKENSNEVVSQQLTGKVDSLLKGNSELKEQLLPFQEFAKNLYPSETNEKALKKLQEELQSTKRFVSSENAIIKGELQNTKDELFVEKNTLKDLSSIMSIKFSGEWNDKPYPSQVFSTVNDVYYLLFEDSKKKFPRIEFYATEQYVFKSLSENTSEFTVRQSVRKGSQPLGSMIDVLDNYDIINVFIPFILYSNFKKPLIKISELRIDLIINGKIVKQFKRDVSFSADVKFYHNNKSQAWATIGLKTTMNTIMEEFK